MQHLLIQTLKASIFFLFYAAKRFCIVLTYIEAFPPVCLVCGQCCLPAVCETPGRDPGCG